MDCPNCKSKDLIFITYGAPPVSGAKLAAMLEKQEIVLGGCINCGDAPAWHCRSCGHRFGDAREMRKPKFRWFGKKA